MPSTVNATYAAKLDAGITELGRLDPVLARAYQEMIENLDFEGELTTVRAIILKRGLDTILLKDDPETLSDATGP